MAMHKISRDSLMTLEAYAKARKDFRAQVIAHKKNRTVHLGEHVTLIFEDELTIRYQVQEMLRIEKIFEEARHPGRARRLQPAHPRRPQLQGDDADRVRGRRRAPRGAREAEGHRGPRPGCRSRAARTVYAIADEDLERENDEKTSSVHFLRFELTAGDGRGAQVRHGASPWASTTRTTPRRSTPCPRATRAALLKDLA